MGIITFDGGKRFLRYFCLPSIHCLLEITLSFPSLHFYQGIFFFFKIFKEICTLPQGQENAEVDQHIAALFKVIIY